MLTQPEYSDDTLLRLMASDDRDAFTMIYRRYWESLFVAAVKSTRSKSDAADIVQDIFLSLWNRRHQLQIENSLHGYLLASVRFKVIHYIEKNITRRDYLAILTETAVHYFPSDAETNLQLKQVQQLIADTVAKMPPKMKEVYVLSRQEHLSHKEIAQRLGITNETVKKHIQHALALIKTALDHSFISVSLLIICLLQ